MKLMKISLSMIVSFVAVLTMLLAPCTAIAVNAPDDPIVLDSITYRKDIIFYDASYNLPDRTTKVVYRDRNYSNGTVITDTIYSGTSQFVPVKIYKSPKGSTKEISYTNSLIRYVVGDDTIDVHQDESGVSSDKLYQSTVKSSTKLNKIDVNTFAYIGITDAIDDIWDYSKYKNAISREMFDENNPVDGWYFQYVGNRTMMYYSPNNTLLFSSLVEPDFYAYFLYIDGKIIDFNEFALKVAYVWEGPIFCEENETRGEALVFKSGFKGAFLGREINMMTIDTFYVAKGDTIANRHLLGR